jgi:HEAT repeat protein
MGYSGKIMLWNKEFNEIVLAQIPDVDKREALKNILEEENLETKRLLAEVLYPQPYHAYCERIMNAITISSHPESSKLICQFFADTTELGYYLHLHPRMKENMKYLWHREPETMLKLMLPYLDVSSEARDEFCKLLGEMGTHDTAIHILPLLDDVNKTIQYHALEALAKLKSADTALPVLQYLQKVARPFWDTDARGIEAAETLWAIDNLDIILSALQDRNDWVRDAITHDGQRIYDHRAIPSLYAALNDSSPCVLCFAIENLSYLSDISIFPDLLKFLNHESEAVCKNAIDALLHIDEVEAFPHIIPILYKSDWYRTHLWWKLDRIENQDVASQLRERLLEYPEIQQIYEVEEKMKKWRTKK